MKFTALCRNEDYLEVQRAMRREIKAMFDRHGIPVPFPQVVLSNREDAKPAPQTEEQILLSESGEDKPEPPQN